MMERGIAVVLMIGLVAGCTCASRKVRGSSGSGTSATDSEMSVGSASYFLEMGVLHERYRDPASAMGYFGQALQLAKKSEQRVQAHLGLARIEEAQGEVKASIHDLEAVLAEREKVGDGGPVPPAMFAGPRAGDDIVKWLGRMYIAAGRSQDAERLYESALAKAGQRWERDMVLPLQMDLWKRMGSLPQHIAEKEAALESKAPDESDLRFLALAYNGGVASIGLVSPGWAEGGPKGPDLDKLVRVYERLYELHREDVQLRQALISLYERQGKVDETIRLLREVKAAPANLPLAAGPPTVPQASCLMGMVPRPTPLALATETEVVRVLVRTGRSKQALEQTAKLVASGGKDNSTVARAHIQGARLYLEQGQAELAERTLKAALKVAETPEDRRELAAAQADMLMRTRKTAELKALLERWKTSEDPCIRAEASRREQLLAQTPTALPTVAVP